MISYRRQRSYFFTKVGLIWQASSTSPIQSRISARKRKRFLQYGCSQSNSLLPEGQGRGLGRLNTRKYTIMWIFIQLSMQCTLLSMAMEASASTPANFPDITLRKRKISIEKVLFKGFLAYSSGCSTFTASSSFNQPMCSVEYAPAASSRYRRSPLATL